MNNMLIMDRPLWFHSAHDKRSHAFVWYFSTVGQDIINKFALESKQAGRDREEIRPEELEEFLADAVYNTRNSKCCGT